MSLFTAGTTKEVKCGVSGFNWEKSLDFTKIRMTTEHIFETGLEGACAKYGPSWGVKQHTPCRAFQIGTSFLLELPNWSNLYRRKPQMKLVPQFWICYTVFLLKPLKSRILEALIGSKKKKVGKFLKFEFSLSLPPPLCLTFHFPVSLSHAGSLRGELPQTVSANNRFHGQ